MNLISVFPTIVPYVDVLHETSTSGVELLRFKISEEIYAVNVAKVSEILHLNNLSKVPNSNNAIAGVSLIRSEVVTVIDTLQVLEGSKNQNIGNSMALVCEYDNLKVAFAIDEVLGIAKVDMLDIKKPSKISSSNLVKGNINYENEIIMLLDFEKILSGIDSNFEVA